MIANLLCVQFAFKNINIESYLKKKCSSSLNVFKYQQILGSFCNRSMGYLFTIF